MGAPDSLLGRTLVLVAHPDDESVGAGGLLQRMAEPLVVFCTDGAPRDEYFWGRHGSRLRYARLRQQEALAALSLAGAREVRFLAEEFGDPERFVDQELHRSLPQALDSLGEMVGRSRPNAILTTAYEGGHPDHDACSLLASVLARRYGVEVWEFPLYHREAAPAAQPEADGELVFQQFLQPSLEAEIVLDITGEELAIKRRMIAAYQSQHPFLGEFQPTRENFRRQPAYDYSRPPHPGKLNYEAWGWRVNGAEVCCAFQEFVEGSRAA